MTDLLPDRTTGPRPVTWQDRLRGSRIGTMVVLAVTACLVMGGVYLVDRPKDSAASVSVGTTDDAPGPRVGRPAQDFTATTVTGQKVSLSSLKGHPVWLTFGASWCTACQAEAPDIEAAYRKVASQGVVVLQVNISEDAAAAKDYGDRIGVTYDIVADPDSTIADEYKVSGIPDHFFIDASGTVRAMRSGGLSPDEMARELATITS